MKVYLSGPMTGIENYNFPEFFRIAQLLRDQEGWEVESPAEFDIQNGWVKAEFKSAAVKWEDCAMTVHSTPEKFVMCACMELPHRFTATPSFDYEAALAKDCELIRECDAIVLMPGWEESGGARRELHAALRAAKEVYTWSNTVQYASKLANPAAWKALRQAQGLADPFVAGDSWFERNKDALFTPGCRTESSDLPAPGPKPLRSPEVHEAIGVFIDLLLATLGDGSDKRMRGEKPSWKVDEHMSHVHSHLGKYSKGEVIDPDSGVHTLAHAACRLLFIAAAESGRAGWMRPAPPDATLDYPEV